MRRAEKEDQRHGSPSRREHFSSLHCKILQTWGKRLWVIVCPTYVPNNHKLGNKENLHTSILSLWYGHGDKAGGGGGGQGANSYVLHIMHTSCCALQDVKWPGRSCTLICLTPQLTSLLGWYKSHEMSNICGEKRSNTVTYELLVTQANFIFALCIILSLYFALNKRPSLKAQSISWMEISK